MGVVLQYRAYSFVRVLRIDWCAVGAILRIQIAISLQLREMSINAHSGTLKGKVERHYASFESQRFGLALSKN